MNTDEAFEHVEQRALRNAIHTNSQLSSVVSSALDGGMDVQQIRTAASMAKALVEDLHKLIALCEIIAYKASDSGRKKR